MSQPVLQKAPIAALALRGAKAYVSAPSAYVTLTAFYFLTGYLFTLPLFLAGQASIRGLMDFVPLVMTFLVPGLTMGLLSEELRSGTFETLATLPLEDWDIVLGKYLGFCALCAAAVAGLAFYPAVLAWLAQPPAGLDWGESFGILAGIFLLGLMYGAIGLFASSLAKNQIACLVTAFMLCFGFFLIGKAAHFFPGLAGSLAGWLGIDAHLAALAKGVFDTRDLVYFASVALAFLYLAAQRLRSRRF